MDNLSIEGSRRTSFLIGGGKVHTCLSPLRWANLIRRIFFGYPRRRRWLIEPIEVEHLQAKWACVYFGILKSRSQMRNVPRHTFPFVLLHRSAWRMRVTGVCDESKFPWDPRNDKWIIHRKTDRVGQDDSDQRTKHLNYPGTDLDGVDSSRISRATVPVMETFIPVNMLRISSFVLGYRISQALGFQFRTPLTLRGATAMILYISWLVTNGIITIFK